MILPVPRKTRLNKETVNESSAPGWITTVINREYQKNTQKQHCIYTCTLSLNNAHKRRLRWLYDDWKWWTRPPCTFRTKMLLFARRVNGHTNRFRLTKMFSRETNCFISEEQCPCEKLKRSAKVTFWNIPILGSLDVSQFTFWNKCALIPTRSYIYVNIV